MSQRKRNETKRATLDKIDSMRYHVKENTIKLNRHNTFQHELAKFLLAWEALQQENDFIAEAIFKNGKRADLVILQQGEAWEVLHSESKKSIEAKKEDYPCKVIPFKAKDVIEAWIPLMQG